MSSRRCEIHGERLVAYASGSLVPLWEIRFEGHDIVRIAPQPNGDRCLAILASRRRPSATFPNLVCVGPTGDVQWRAAPPEAVNDAFVAAAWDGARILANTWSCFQVSLDPTTGAAIEARFTK